MDWITLIIVAGVGVAAAGYVLYRLPSLTATRRQAWVARLVLSLTGIAFGAFAVKQIGAGQPDAILVLIFMAAWGGVHVPAAIILLLKRWQRNSR